MRVPEALATPELIYPAASSASTATPPAPAPAAIVAGASASTAATPGAAQAAATEPTETPGVSMSLTPPTPRTAVAVQFGAAPRGTPPTPSRSSGGVFAGSGPPSTPHSTLTPPTPTLGMRLMTTVPLVVAPKSDPPTLQPAPPLPQYNMHPTPPQPQSLPESQLWPPAPQAGLANAVTAAATGVAPSMPSMQQSQPGSSVSTCGGSMATSVGAPSGSSVAGSSILATPPPALTALAPLSVDVPAAPEPLGAIGGTMTTMAGTMAGTVQGHLAGAVAGPLASTTQVVSPLTSGRAAALMQTRPSSTGRHRSAAFPGIGSMALSRPRTSPQLGAAEMRRPHSANTRFNQQPQPRLAQTTMYMAGNGTRMRDRSRAGSRADSRGSSTGRVAINSMTGTVNVIVAPSRSVSPGPGRASARAPSRNSEGPRRSSAIRTASPHSANQIWSPLWTELLELVEKWRTGGPGTERATGQQLPPDPGRTRKVCQVLASVVNQVPDVSLRRILLVLAEELYHATFRDYSFAYNPAEDRWINGATQHLLSDPGRPAVRSTQPLPQLSEETVANAVPYFAVVQSLRDAAKDAIMRRLELEAKCANEANGEEEKRSSRPSTPRGQVASLRANEELQLREELRHARLLADTYQARTLELERLRLENEEEASRMRFERETDGMRRQKLENEARRLRAEVEALRAERAYHAEASKAAGVGYALQEAANKVMRAESITRDKRTRRRSRTESADWNGTSDDDFCMSPTSYQESSAAETESTSRHARTPRNGTATSSVASRTWQRCGSDGSQASTGAGAADMAAGGGKAVRRSSDLSQATNSSTSSAKQLPGVVPAGAKRVRSAAREDPKASPKPSSKQAPSTPRVGTHRSNSGYSLRLGGKSAAGNT